MILATRPPDTAPELRRQLEEVAAQLGSVSSQLRAASVEGERERDANAKQHQRLITALEGWQHEYESREAAEAKGRQLETENQGLRDECDLLRHELASMRGERDCYLRGLERIAAFPIPSPVWELAREALRLAPATNHRNLPVVTGEGEQAERRPRDTSPAFRGAPGPGTSGRVQESDLRSGNS